LILKTERKLGIASGSVPHLPMKNSGCETCSLFYSTWISRKSL